MGDFNYAIQIKEMWQERKDRKDITEVTLNSLAGKFNNGTYSIFTPFEADGKLKTTGEVQSDNNAKILIMNTFIQKGSEQSSDLSSAPGPAAATVKDIADKRTAALFLQLCGNNYFLSEEIFEKGILKGDAGGVSGGVSGGKRNRRNKKHTKRLLSDVSRIASVKHKKEEKRSTKITNRISQNAKSTLKK